MRIVFRVDASLQIGSGHVMRCLTLAEELRERGGECFFVSREHHGNLLKLIRQRKFQAVCLPLAESDSLSWLGAPWEVDADQTIAALRTISPRWLIVDHYAIAEQWEQVVRPFCGGVMVIDDLANRPHLCDLLLDQNLGRSKGDYRGYLNTSCKLFVGPKYALLHPDFAQWREYSLARRRTRSCFGNLLITMGGVDANNATGLIIEALASCQLPPESTITIVMGSTAPWLQQVSNKLTLLPWKTELKVGVNNMAQLMAKADLCIGAAGSSSWERCVLGLPSILVCLADNQKSVIEALSSYGAAISLDLEILQERGSDILDRLLMQAQELTPNMIEKAILVTDGEGRKLLAEQLLGTK